MRSFLLEIKPQNQIKRLGKPETSGLHHRLTTQRFILSPNKQKFIQENIGSHNLKTAYFGLFFNLLLYGKANNIGSLKFNVSNFKSLKDYNWSQFKKKDKLISSFSEAFEFISSLYYEEMQNYLKYEELKIEKDQFDNKAFLDIIMYSLPISEPYFKNDFLMDTALTELIDELRLRAQRNLNSTSAKQKKKSK